MAKYQVTLTKYETYEVEAEDMEHAEDLACELCDNDKMAWSDPVDKIEVTEIKKEQLYHCRTTCEADILATSEEEAQAKMWNMLSPYKILKNIKTDIVGEYF